MLVVTRNEAIGVLERIMVAPVTRTIRNIATEVALGEDQGLTVDCVASFDNLQPIRRSYLISRVGRLGGDGSHAICRATAALTDC